MVIVDEFRRTTAAGSTRSRARSSSNCSTGAGGQGRAARPGRPTKVREGVAKVIGLAVPAAGDSGV